MTLRHRFSLRTIAAGSVLGLTAGTAAVLGATSPASALPIDFDCEVPIVGAKTFGLDMSSDAPATVPPGSSVAPTITSVMTVPEDLAGLLRGVLSIDEVAGTVEATTLVDGVETPTTLTIPRSDIGDSGPAVLTGTGTLPSFPAGDLGTVHEIAAGAQSVTMTLFDLEGAPGGSPFVIPCVPGAGENTVLDTIAVKAASTTAVKASYAKKTKTAKATATVAGDAGPTGKVEFKLMRGAQQVKKVTVSLKNGKAVATFKKVSKKGKYTVKAAYKGSATSAGSKGSASFRVR
jgi:hypothetical protein